jgi:hypothetical protein
VERAKESQRTKAKDSVTQKDGKGKMWSASGKGSTPKCYFSLEWGHINANCSGFLWLTKKSQYVKTRSALLMDQIYFYDLSEDTVGCEVCQYCLQESCTYDTCVPPVEKGLMQDSTNLFIREGMLDVVEEAKQWQASVHPPLTKDMLLQQTFVNEESWETFEHGSRTAVLQCSSGASPCMQRTVNRTLMQILTTDNHRVCNQCSIALRKSGTTLLVIDIIDPSSHGKITQQLNSPELKQRNLISHEEEEIFEDSALVQIFYSQDRLMRDEDGACHINAGSIEICRAKISLDVVRKGAVTLLFAEGKLDTCRSVSLAHSSYLRNIWLRWA